MKDKAYKILKFTYFKVKYFNIKIVAEILPE